MIAVEAGADETPGTGDTSRTVNGVIDGRAIPILYLRDMPARRSPRRRARRLAALDGMLRLIDSSGNVLASNDDAKDKIRNC